MCSLLDLRKSSTASRLFNIKELLEILFLWLSYKTEGNGNTGQLEIDSSKSILGLHSIVTCDLSGQANYVVTSIE